MTDGDHFVAEEALIAPKTETTSSAQPQSSGQTNSGVQQGPQPQIKRPVTPVKLKNVKPAQSWKDRKSKSALQRAEAEMNQLRSEELLLMKMMNKLNQKKRQLLIENDKLRKIQNEQRGHKSAGPSAKKPPVIDDQTPSTSQM